MSNQNIKSTEQEEQGVQVHISPDLDYAYRDVANIFVGAGDVLFEFGNYHRSMPGHVTISNRVVMSVAAAYELQARLQQVLMEAQNQVQENLKHQKTEP